MEYVVYLFCLALSGYLDIKKNYTTPQIYFLLGCLSMYGFLFKYTK